MSKRGARTGPPPVRPGDVIEVDKGGGKNFTPETVTRVVGSRICFTHRRSGTEAYVYARSFGRIWRLPINSEEEQCPNQSKP